MERHFDGAERIGSEKALRKKQEQFLRITDNMLDAVEMTDMEGRVEFASGSYERLFGFTPQDLLGKNALEIVHPEDLNKVTKAIERGLDSLSNEKVVYRHKCSNGTYKWAETLGNFIFDHQQQPVGAIFGTGDVSEQKKLMEELEILKTIMEEGVEGRYIANHDGYITYVNNVYAQMHDYNPQDLIGKHFSLLHPDSKSMHLKKILRKL